MEWRLKRLSKIPRELWDNVFYAMTTCKRRELNMRYSTQNTVALLIILAVYLIEPD